MTREEADKIQGAIDGFVEARKKVPKRPGSFVWPAHSRREGRGGSLVDQVEEATKGDAASVANKWRNRFMDTAHLWSREALINLIEPLLPNWEKEAGLPDGFNLLIGGFMSMFSSDKLKDMSSYIAVVDGHEEAAKEEPADEFHKKYCIAVPSDIVKDAWHRKSTRSLVNKVLLEKAKGK